jgi:hypothetical protein
MFAIIMLTKCLKNSWNGEIVMLIGLLWFQGQTHREKRSSLELEN